MGTMVGTEHVEEYILLALGETRSEGNVETGTSSLNDLFLLYLTLVSIGVMCLRVQSSVRTDSHLSCKYACSRIN